MEHLFSLFHSGKADGSGFSYSSLNAARSAISAVAKINGIPAGQNELVCLFMRSASKQRSQLPRNNLTWDPDAFLRTFDSWGDNNNLSLSQLAKKVAGLLLILSGQRFQTIDCLDIRNMSLADNEVIFKIGDPLKTSTVRHHFQHLSFKAFPDNKNLCIVDAIASYLRMTENLRIKSGHSKLLLTTRKPFGPASKTTITRWIRDIMKESGISGDIFRTYSVRSASTSKAFQSGMAWERLSKAVGWRRESTFTKHYNKPILPVGSFGETILQSYKGNR